MERADPRPLNRLVKTFALILGAAFLYVLFDFMIDLRPPGIHSSYRFGLQRLQPDQPLLLQQDNLSIVVILRSADTIAALQRETQKLQDPGSDASRQPDYAGNPLRSRHPEYFVAYAIGTDLGCVIEVEAATLAETCGPARYDFAGRSLKGERGYRNLSIPDYNFSDDFRTLTIRP